MVLHVARTTGTTCSMFAACLLWPILISPWTKSGHFLRAWTWDHSSMLVCVTMPDAECGCTLNISINAILKNMPQHLYILYLSVSSFYSNLSQHWSISTTIRWVTIKFGTDIKSTQRTPPDWSPDIFCCTTMSLTFLVLSDMSWQLLDGLTWNLEIFKISRGCILMTLVMPWLLHYCHLQIKVFIYSVRQLNIRCMNVHAILYTQSWEPDYESH